MICVHDSIQGVVLEEPYAHLVAPDENGEFVRCPDGHAPEGE